MSTRLTEPGLGPSYRERLRLEGGALAACGLVGSLVLLAWFGPRSVHKAVAEARPAGEIEPTGEPTPLWHLPLIVAGLATPFLFLGAWDAGLRVTGGCLLVGLAQAILLERVVAGHEREARRVYVRAPGSRLLRGTRLTWASVDASGSPAGFSAQPRT